MRERERGRERTNLDSELAFRNISAFRAHLIIRISWSSRVPPHHFSSPQLNKKIPFFLKKIIPKILVKKLENSETQIQFLF